MDKKQYQLTFRLEKPRSVSAKRQARGEDVSEQILQADITFGRKRCRYYSGYRVKESQWDQEKQQMRRNNFTRKGVSASDVNARLAKIKVAAEQAFSELEHNGIEPTPQTVIEGIRRYLSEEKTERRTVADCYMELIEERRVELKESPQTAVWRYGTWKKHLTMYNHWIGYRKGAYFEDVTAAVLDGFERYLVGKGLSNSYVGKSMTDFNTFLNWAVKKGYCTNLAFRERKQLLSDGTKNEASVYALSEDELMAVINIVTASASLCRTRDVFVFCCFSGLRFGDAMGLRWSDIYDDGVDLVAEKTGQHIRIPLNNTLRKILARYKGVCQDGRVFPKISNQKFNDQLKKIGQLAGFNSEWVKTKKVGNTVVKTPMKKWECLSSHVARRTFVSYALSIGIPPEVIRSITGHSTSKMMQTYVKLSQGVKREFMERMDQNTSAEEDTRTKEPSTVYDLVESDTDIKSLGDMLGIPEQKKYLRQVEKEPLLAVLHLALYLWNTSGASAAARYIDLLSGDWLDTFYSEIARTRSWKK
ncbi:MAG: site-specific integrase [Bacteroidales bacterium]|nr:site-specific integrase [Bacteroidales bacterium]